MQTKLGFKFPDSDTHFEEFTFEVGHIPAALRHFARRRVCIEGGAHVGGWTTVLAGLFDEVHAFEPQPQNFECLKENTMHLQNVHCYPVALGDTNRTGAMHQPVNPGNSGAGWVVPGDEIEIKTIDSFGFQNVDFIKLDVEGFEVFAIMGAQETIAKWRPAILVEQKAICARYSKPFNAAGTLLESMGYKQVAEMNADFLYCHE